MNNTEKKQLKNIWLGFSKKNRIERISILRENGFIDQDIAEILLDNISLSCELAEQITENNIGIFSLPFSVAPDFLIDNKEFVIPMVTEEPSVVAACSYAGKLISRSGGFNTEIHNRNMKGHLTLFDIPDVPCAIENILKNKELILDIADKSYPSIVSRGGGARSIEIDTFTENNSPFLSVYLIADVKEAMGANIINTMLEGIKPLLEDITGGKVLMAILSNYATEALVTSSCEIDIRYLSNDKKEAINTAEKIQLASLLAKADIYRASTHNKGIFNGIDAVSIATGNDWRAVEAGAHAYACKNGRYEGLTTWVFNKDSNKLSGTLTLPMHIASVGGSIGLNPSVKAAFNILGNPDAKTLASVIVSVGLAQNLAALKALVTTGIQKGHMKLQAKSLALLAGASEKEVEEVVSLLLKESHMNLSTAETILNKIRQ